MIDRVAVFIESHFLPYRLYEYVPPVTYHVCRDSAAKTEWNTSDLFHELLYDHHFLYLRVMMSSFESC